MPTLTTSVTLIAIALYFWLAARVAASRRRLGVELPSISGPPEFERIFRVQQNTLEWTPIFLVPLWICGLRLGDAAAAAVGAVWIVGRIVYALGYSRSVAGRLPGFAIQAMACTLLFGGAAFAVGRDLVRAWWP